MTEQLSLPLAPDKFSEWVHSDCGREIAGWFVRLSVRMLNRGHKHYSADAIAHRIRWHLDLRNGPDAGGYKINNNWVAGLARFAESREPRLAGFFQKRRLQNQCITGATK